MEFESKPEIKEENTQIDLSGGLVDQHFALDLSELITSGNGTGGDSSSSIESNSPPHEWNSSWMDSASVNPSVGITTINPGFFAGSTTPSDFDIQNGMMDFTSINNMHLELPMDMFNQPFSFMLPPEELHKSPNTFPHAQQSMTNGTNGVAPMDEDIVATIKRLTGITNAQVAGAPSSFNVGLHGMSPYAA